MRLSDVARRWRAQPGCRPLPRPGPPGVEAAARRNRGSLQLRHVDAGSCNGCELEIASIFSPVYDAERFGIRLEASPRHADGLLVTGPVTRNMADPLRKTLDAVPRPRGRRRGGRLRPQLRRVRWRLRRRGLGERRRTGRSRDPRLPAGPGNDHHRVAGPGRYVSGALLVATALVGLAAACIGAMAPPRIRTQLSAALTIAACGCGLAAAAGVLHSGHSAVVYTNRLLPLAGFSLVLDRFGALFVAITAVVGALRHGLPSRLRRTRPRPAGRRRACCPCSSPPCCSSPPRRVSPRSCSSGS